MSWENIRKSTCCNAAVSIDWEDISRCSKCRNPQPKKEPGLKIIPKVEQRKDIDGEDYYYDEPGDQ